MASNLTNSFTKKLRESTLAARLRKQAEKVMAAQKLVENFRFSDLSKTMTFSHSNIFNDSADSHHAESLSDISELDDSNHSESVGLKTSSVSSESGSSSNSSVPSEQCMGDDEDRQQEAMVQLALEEKRLQIRESEIKLRKEQTAKDEAEVRRHEEQEKEIEDTLENLHTSLKVHAVMEHREHEDSVREEDEVFNATAKVTEITPDEVEEQADGNIVKTTPEKVEKQADESIVKCLKEEKRREDIIRDLQNTLAEEQKALEWSKRKTREEQEKLMETIPQKVAENREAQLKQAERKEEERRKQLEELQRRKKEQQKKKKAEDKYLKEFEKKDAEARARAREKEKTEERKQHIQFVRKFQTGQTDLTGGATATQKEPDNKQIEEDAEIARRLHEEESLDRERQESWAAIHKLQEEQERRCRALEAEEESLRLEDQMRKVQQMKKDNDERESRLKKMLEDEEDVEEVGIHSPPSTGGAADYFQTPAFNPKRRSTMLGARRSNAVGFPDTECKDLPSLHAEGGTFNIPAKGGRGRTGASSELPDLEARRREFERTVMEAGGVTLKEQELLEMEAAEDMSSSVNPSCVSFTVSRSKEEIPTFSGDIIDYQDWKTLFESYMTPFPKPEHLSTLKKKLGKQEVLIAGCTGLTESALKRAWTILDATFGSADRVKTILLTQIEELVSVPYTNNTMFISTVRQVRDKFDRLLRVDRLSIVGVNNHILGLFLRAMPSWLFRKASKIKREEPNEWNFNSVLKLAEKSVLEIEDQNWLLKGPGSLRYQVVPSKPKVKELHCLTADGQDSDYIVEGYEEEVEGEEFLETATHQLYGAARGRSRGGGSSKGAGSQGAGRGAGRGAGSPAGSQDSQGRGRLSRTDMRNPYAKCMVCDCEDHLTVECPISPGMDPGQLKALTEARKICVLCGRPGHRSLFCPFHTVRMDNTGDSLTCKSEACSATPHSKVFCTINRKT